MRTFDEITKHLKDTHYYDKESWYKEILCTKYDSFTDENFGVLFEIKKIGPLKIGHSRGGVRFDKIRNSYQDYLKFIHKLTNYLNDNGYIFLGIDFMQEESEFTNVFKPSMYKEFIYGTAIVYPSFDWIKKFNSKKKYDLLYAEKKNCRVKFYEDGELEESLFMKLYQMMNFTIDRHKSKYTNIDFDVFKRILTKEKKILGVIFDDQNNPICFNLLLYNPLMNRAERLFSSVSEAGLKNRAAGFLEVKTIELLAKKNIQIYDLWGISGKMDGVEVFKRSIADEIIQFVPFYGVLRVNIVLSLILEILTRVKMNITFLLNKLLRKTN